MPVFKKSKVLDISDFKPKLGGYGHSIMKRKAVEEVVNNKFESKTTESNLKSMY